MINVVSLDWKSKRKIDDIIDQIAFSRVKSFYPTYIHKITGNPLNEVFNYLLYFVRDGRLKLIWEIRCDNPVCNEVIIRTDDNIQNYLNKIIECHECESDVLVRESLIFPTFEINGDYRDEIREDKKKNEIY